MSSRAGPQSPWLWSNTIGHYRIDSANQRYVLEDGSTVPIQPARRVQSDQDPRNTQHLPSARDVTRSSRPEAASAPPNPQYPYQDPSSNRPTRADPMAIYTPSTTESPYPSRSGSVYSSSPRSSTNVAPNARSDQSRYPAGPRRPQSSLDEVAFSSSSKSQSSARAPFSSQSATSDRQISGTRPMQRADSSTLRSGSYAGSYPSSTYSASVQGIPSSPENLYGTNSAPSSGGQTPSLYPGQLVQSMAHLSMGGGPSNQFSSSSQQQQQGQSQIDFTDPQSRVRTVVRTGPSAQTDPKFAQFGIHAHKQLIGTETGEELLYPAFKKREKPKKFFTLGKVFMILWAEPAGESANNNTLITSAIQASKSVPGKYGERIFSKVRRFIVIRESDQYCSALSIVSYGRQGVAKNDAIKSEHGIVYIGKEPPEPTEAELPQRGETAMLPTAIRIDPDQKEDKLTSTSRINYGKVYTVEHNVKVCSIGSVNKRYIHALIYQFKQVWTPGVGASSSLGVIPEQHDISVAARSSSKAPVDHASMVQHFMRQGFTREKAEAILRKIPKPKQAQSVESHGEDDDESESSDEHGEVESTREMTSGDIRLEKAIRRLVGYGFTREKALSVIRKQQRKSAQAQSDGAPDDEDSQSDESEADSRVDHSTEENTRSRLRSRNEADPQQQAARAVQELQQKGYTYEEAVRMVKLGLAKRNQGSHAAGPAYSKGKGPA